MVSLLKTFGKGLLYVIGLPFFLVALVLFGAAGLIAFIIQLFMSIIYFFSGRKFFPDLPEDLELRALREGPRANDNDEEEEEEEPITEAYAEPHTIPQEQQPFIYPFFEEKKPQEEAPIIQDVPEREPEPEIEEEIEPSIEEEVKPDPVLFNDDSSIEETIETSSEEEEEEEELETYVPRSSSFSVNDDDTEEESGVDIKYDL